MRSSVISKIHEVIQEHIVPGMIAAYCTRETTEMMIEGVQGVCAPFSLIPLNQEMQVDMASCTKVMGTTTRILQLIDEKQLDFTTQVSDLLPRFQYPQVTIGHLLLHRSGLPADVADKQTLTSENIIERVYATELVNPVDEVTCYSDLSFILLGWIIEKVDGCSLEESYQRHIFKPLNMMKTTYHVQDAKNCLPTEITEARGCIQGIVHDRKGFLLQEAGSAGLFSTIEDVVRFVRSLMFEENPILSSQTIQRLLDTTLGERTYGWQKPYGKNVLYHTGFAGASILMDFAQQEALILLTNRIHPTRDNQAYLSWREEINQLFLQGK